MSETDHPLSKIIYGIRVIAEARLVHWGEIPPLPMIESSGRRVVVYVDFDVPKHVHDDLITHGWMNNEGWSTYVFKDLA